jgi:hypothetical protein
MTRLAAVLAACLCCATLATADLDQWTGTTQIAAVPKDPRSNVMQFPKRLLVNAAQTGAPIDVPQPVQVPNQAPPSPPAQP